MYCSDLEDGTNYITAIHNTTLTNHIMSSAAAVVVFKRTITDSVTVNDDIVRIGMRVGDDVGSADDIVYKAPATFDRKDSVFVQDVLRATTTKPIFDSVNAEDDIVTIGMRVGDDVGSTDYIVYKAPATFDRKDSAFVQDVLRATTTKPIFDSVNAEDDIITIGMRVGDDVGSADDIVYKAPATFDRKDSAFVQDVLRATTTKPIFDSVNAEDDIITIGMRVGDDVGSP